MHRALKTNTMTGPSKPMLIVCCILQVIAAVILAQTLFFKFSGAEESKFIFSALGVEPWGRVATGVVELVAVVMFLAPRTVVLGALLSLGLMAGAIGSHLTKLGTVVKDDGGLLFGLAVTVFVCSAVILSIRRRQIPVLGAVFVPPHALSCPTKECSR
jgi:hypothetical protein